MTIDRLNRFQWNIANLRIARITALLLASYYLIACASFQQKASASKYTETKLPPGFALVTGGTFLMGSTDDESERDNDEGPVHKVTVASFAMGLREVTRKEFGEFVLATNYLTDSEKSEKGCGAPKPDSGVVPSWRNPGWTQSADHPVVCVSRRDAEQYAAWKSTQSGATLRLPTEAEFEYTLRAGGQSTHPWGSDGNKGCIYGNIGDVNFKEKFEKTANTGSCDDGYTYTSPAGLYLANKYGIQDLSGNVWEWSADCYNASYVDAPVDGSARKSENCEFGVLRGASFDDGPRYQRSANRVKVPPKAAAWVFGIRLAMDL